MASLFTRQLTGRLGRQGCGAFWTVKLERTLISFNEAGLMLAGLKFIFRKRGQLGRPAWPRAYPVRYTRGPLPGERCP